MAEASKILKVVRRVPAASLPIADILAGAAAHRQHTGCPLVTLAYAQSLDGSLTAQRGKPLHLSSPESYEISHALRAAHAAILVGIGAALADDPRLTARQQEGLALHQPRPVVLDSWLRLPLAARLLQHPQQPWIATLADADPQKKAALQSAGARLLIAPPDARGQISLSALLKQLGELGIDSLMVEGGASVITSFLAGRLADQVVVTIAPYYVGGLHVVQHLLSGASLPDRADQPGMFPRLVDPAWTSVGPDWLVWGKLM